MRRNERGATLVEALAASGVLVIGILGLLASQTVAARQNHMAARQVRASTLAQDAVSAIRRWPYDDPRLANVTANDTGQRVVLESGPVGENPPDPAHFERDINATSASLATYAPMIGTAALDENGDGVADYRRYLHVAPLMANGMQIGIVATVVVAWRSEFGWRQVVMRQSKYDPAGNLATIPGL